MRKKLFKKEYLWILISLFAVAFGVFFLWISTFNIPNLDAFEQRKVQESTKIYDRTGEILLYDVFENIRRTVIPFEDISEYAKMATISIEDRDFYNHRGVKPTSFIRAAFVNVRDQDFSQGGSTITQQVIKNALLSPEKKISRKIKEWVLAIRLERIIDKDEILAIYLNEIPYGGTIYGIEEASRSFFGKSAGELTVAESAYLAALPKAPTYLSPYGVNRSALEARKDLVLEKMFEYKFIDQEKYKEALNEEVEFRERGSGNFKAPHFVMYVIDVLQQKYGEEVLEHQGFRIITTLDYELQEQAEEIVRKRALDNATTFNAENGALIAIDPNNGHILTMVGSRGYDDPDIQGQYNITTSKRQPGSSFKPIVYANALNRGYTPETIVFDLRTQFSTSCSPSDMSTGGNCYAPQNYDLTFRGPMTFRNALAQSVNVPAVKALYLGGADSVLKLARDMGITSLTGSRHDYGLPLALGAAEVSPLELASAYGIFATGGIRNEYQPIIRIEDNSGNIIEEFESFPQRVIPEQTALEISDMLSDNAARTPAFGANSLLYFAGRDVAVKTGTTNDYVDAWIIGYTPNLVVASWAGNNDSRPMERRVAGFIVAPMWRDFMNIAVNARPNQSFKKPAPLNFAELKPILRGVWQGGQSYVVEPEAHNETTNINLTPAISGQEFYFGGVHSILHWVDKNNPRGPIPSNPASDPQYHHWEFPVRLWSQSHGFQAPQIPIDQNQNPNFLIDITGLQLEYERNERVSFDIISKSPNPIEKAQIFFNGIKLADIGNSNLSFSFNLIDFDHILEESNNLRVIAQDFSGNNSVVSKTFNLR